MPQTQASSSAELSIRLERGHPNFTLPDTVVGHVSRKIPIVASQATVTIALTGRAKSKAIVRHDSIHVSRNYRGRFALTNGSEYTKTLFEGPLHVSADDPEKAWPFTIPLPTQYDARLVEPGTKQDESFLPLASDGGTKYKLPPTFEHQNWGFGVGMGCFVEYLLRAELSTPGRKSSNVVEAVLPLTITTLHSGPTPREAPLREVRQELCLSNLGLAATNGRPKSQPPQSAFSVCIKTATTLQLGQNDLIPFFIHAELSQNAASAAAKHLTSQAIFVKEAAINFIAVSDIKCQGRRNARDSNDEKTFRLFTKFQQLDPFTVPWKYGAAASSSADNTEAEPANQPPQQPFNVGRHLNLKLPDGDLYECFTTFNIQHSHRIDWNIIIEVAGERFTCAGSSPVIIIPPSSDDEPMDYAELERQDTLELARSQSVDAVPPGYGGHEDFDQPLPPRQPRSGRGGAYGLAPLWRDV